MAVSTIPAPSAYISETQTFSDISVNANAFTTLAITSKTGYTLASVYLAIGGTHSGTYGFVKMYNATGIIVNNTSSSNMTGWSVTAYCLWRKN